MRIIVLAVGLLIAGPMAEGMNARRDNCGDECAVTHYCNKHNSLCTPCSNICDEGNYLEKECNAYCRAYLVTRMEHQYEDLRSEVSKLWSFATAAIAVAFLSLMVAACLLANRFVKWKTIGGAFHRTFFGTWTKTTSVNKNNNHENNNKPEDVETGAHRRNGPKLAMPTISATVAPSRDPGIVRQKTVGSGNGNGSGQIQVQVQSQGQGRGNETAENCAGADNSTPNTTTTTLSLSGRHPCEDTTLDYAYDNPAMTPSPESVQIRRDRESSF
ncbi:uncharacterized protein LOC143208230 [Lasioglossum baleicum]|uniref:uncharacterized protein LOC143208230 n=1 Tax=Lasioglossum baleicum TaxID=434251 RepID=UPI003FCE99C7